jgi:flagellar biosynthetic protein FliQ
VTQDVVVRVLQQGLLLVLLVSAPAVLAALVVGLLVSVVQAATQIQEQTLSVAPKLVAVSLTLAAVGLWMVREIAMFAVALLERIPTVGS